MKQYFQGIHTAMLYVGGLGKNNAIVRVCNQMFHIIGRFLASPDTLMDPFIKEQLHLLDQYYHELINIFDNTHNTDWLKARQAFMQYTNNYSNSPAEPDSPPKKKKK